MEAGEGVEKWRRGRKDLLALIPAFLEVGKGNNSSARFGRGATADFSQLRSGWRPPERSNVLKVRRKAIARLFHRPSRTNYFHPHNHFQFRTRV